MQGLRAALARRAGDVLQVAVDEDEVIDDAADSGVALVVVREVQEVEEAVRPHRLSTAISESIRPQEPSTHTTGTLRYFECARISASSVNI